jgi:lipopolysaccharide/colanic/teichoic acid biosynthesis glycosyltransferase
MIAANRELVEFSRKPQTQGEAIARRYESVKPVLDCWLALILFVLSGPVVLICMILVKLTSRGPAIYTQDRLGQGGKIFTIYKIRTMYEGSERGSGPRWSLPGDSRITPFGRILRACHLDELPQLVNVLRGEMSLVGPRPERPELVGPLEIALPRYRQRLTVRPGVTGLAQVQQSPDTDLPSVRRKLNYDLHYVERMSFGLDLRLILGTVLKCFFVPFDVIAWILRLPDQSIHVGAESVHSSQEFAPNSLVSRSLLN